jgi:hypothetical protein
MMLRSPDMLDILPPMVDNSITNAPFSSRPLDHYQGCGGQGCRY